MSRGALYYTLKRRPIYCLLNKPTLIFMHEVSSEPEHSLFEIGASRLIKRCTLSDPQNWTQRSHVSHLSHIRNVISNFPCRVASSRTHAPRTLYVFETWGVGRFKSRSSGLWCGRIPTFRRTLLPSIFNPENLDMTSFTVIKDTEIITKTTLIYCSLFPFTGINLYSDQSSILGRGMEFFFSLSRPNRIRVPVSPLSNVHGEIFPRGVKRPGRET